MSRDAVDALIDGHRVKLVVDLKPALNEEVLRERICAGACRTGPHGVLCRAAAQARSRTHGASAGPGLDIHSKTYVSKLTEAEITRLIRTLKGLTFPITDYAPFEYAVTTAGGVRCRRWTPRRWNR